MYHFGTGMQAEISGKTAKRRFLGCELGISTFLILRGLGHGGSHRICPLKISFQGMDVPQTIV